MPSEGFEPPSPPITHIVQDNIQEQSPRQRQLIWLDSWVAKVRQSGGKMNKKRKKCSDSECYREDSNLCLSSQMMRYSCICRRRPPWLTTAYLSYYWEIKVGMGKIRKKKKNTIWIPYAIWRIRTSACPVMIQLIVYFWGSLKGHDSLSDLIAGYLR
jgi:hypothetical protein